MRNLWKFAATALAALSLTTLLARAATRHGEATPSLEPRGARAEELARTVIPPVQLALANSLWGEANLGPCLVESRWGAALDLQPIQAAFTPYMRLAMRAPLRTPAHAGAWLARATADFAPANDADIASRYVAMEPGVAPVIRVLRVARFARDRERMTLPMTRAA